MHWERRERLDGLPHFTPIESGAKALEISPRGIPENQPKVDWLPHEERPYDTFGRLWPDPRRRDEPEEPTA